MELHCWGVRGSVAAPLTNTNLVWKIEKALEYALKANLSSPDHIPMFMEDLPWHVTQTAGGDTSCYEVIAGDQVIILDAGTGLRPLSLDLLQRSGGRPMELHIFLSHTHWDHICGFPFMVPAYMQGNVIHIYGVHPDLQYRLETQQQPSFFPVPLENMAADIQFHQLRPNARVTLDDVIVRNIPQKHPGGSYGYRITHGNQSIVYSTDAEYTALDEDSVRPVTDFFRDAQLVIFDAQYSFTENMEKEDWGHSNSLTGIDFALQANVEALLLTHHEPSYDDKKLAEILDKSREYYNLYSEGRKLDVFLAREGMHLMLD